MGLKFIMVVGLCLAIIIPFSAILGLSSQLYHMWNKDFNTPEPWRWLCASLVPVFMCVWGLKRGSLNKSGAFAGLLVGFILTLSNLCFFASLAVFFVAGSKVTKFRSKSKRKQELNYREGGQRDWIQVLCNGGVATALSALYMLEIGCKEITINFHNNYNASWLAIAVLTSLACSCGDTFASEVGSVVGGTDPWLILSFRRVPRGTNGGVSFIGTVSSLFGGLLVGLGFYTMLLMRSTALNLIDSPPQWPVIAMGVVGGGMGSIIDSVLGSTLQYSGYHKDLKIVMEHRGKDIEHICGWPVLDNHGVNLVSSLLTGLISPFIALNIWQTYT